MSNDSNQLNIRLPAWLAGYQQSYTPTLHLDLQMDYVIEAARINITQVTGGPFAAGVFNCDSGELLALGVNLVPWNNLSILHAEMVAITLAQQHLHHYSLSTDPNQRYKLLTSCAPCAMCLGAIPWSGISQLVCAASSQDARSIGFDEGDINSDWQAALTKRGIQVQTNIRQEQARAVFTQYLAVGGKIYNAND